jgi:hypothetical protein
LLHIAYNREKDEQGQRLAQACCLQSSTEATAILSPTTIVGQLFQLTVAQLPAQLLLLQVKLAVITVHIVASHLGKSLGSRYAYIDYIICLVSRLPYNSNTLYTALQN